MEYNCGFTDDNRWFRYRAAAIIVEDGCVLFAGNERDDYYYSIDQGKHDPCDCDEIVETIVYERIRPRLEKLPEKWVGIVDEFFSEPELCK